MVPDVEIVRDRVLRIRMYVQDLRAMSAIGLEEFRLNRERQYAVLHALQLAIEACIEIATHICAADALGAPGSYAEAFSTLERSGILAPPLAEDLRAMARFRNRIVHFYWDVEPGQIHQVLKERLTDFERYVPAIETYMQG